MRLSLTILILITGLVASASSRAAFVSSGAIAGVDSGILPTDLVPGSGDIPLEPGFVPFGSVVGNLENGCGLYKRGDDPVSAAGTECPASGLKKAISYDTGADDIVLPVAMEIGLGLIVKEGHPERTPPDSGIDQNQIEDFDIFLIDALTDLVAHSWHYDDEGSTDSTDDAYYAGYFEGEVVAAGSYYLSFRVPGFPDDITDGGSVEYLAQISAERSVPAPSVVWLLVPGFLGLTLTRRGLRSPA